MDQVEKKPFESSYIPLDMEASMNEFSDGVQGGEMCHVPELSDIFAWMRGYVNLFTGWSSDGKGTFTDFLMTLKSKNAGWKWCVFKNEDMDSVRIGGTDRLYKGKPVKVGDRVVKEGGKIEIKANRIYKNLAWTMTGKTWNKDFALRHKCTQMTYDEEFDALDFITQHFFVVNPKDRSYQNVCDEMMFMYEKFGIDGFMIDPWNTVIVNGKDTNDVKLSNAFMTIKDVALKTNTVANIINHAKSMEEEKYKTGEMKGRYKVVNQSMQLGGSAWDMKMDGVYSIYRQERHLDPKDPRVSFYNLKNRQAEVTGTNRGMYDKILFDYVKKQYYFNGRCPMTNMAAGDQLIMNSDSVPF